MSFARVKSEGIKIVTIQDSSFHSLIKKAGFLDSDLKFMQTTAQLFEEVEGAKEKTCTIVDSDAAVYNSRSKIAKFTGTVGSQSQMLAWWVERDNASLLQEVEAFWRDFKKSQEWEKLFRNAYETDYADYLKIVDDL